MGSSPSRPSSPPSSSSPTTLPRPTTLPTPPSTEQPTPTTPPSTLPAPATQPQPPQPSQPPYDPVLHRASLVVAVAAPLALLLPPRRGARQILLAGASLWAANRLVADWDAARRARMGDRTGGRSAVDFVVEAWGAGPRGGRPGKPLDEAPGRHLPGSGGSSGTPPGVSDEARLGDRYADQARRDREVLDQGGSISEIIMAQVRDVWRDRWWATGGSGEGTARSSPKGGVGDGAPTDQRGGRGDAEGSRR